MLTKTYQVYILLFFTNNIRSYLLWAPVIVNTEPEPEPKFIKRGPWVAGPSIRDVGARLRRARAGKTYFKPYPHKREGLYSPKIPF